MGLVKLLRDVEELRLFRSFFGVLAPLLYLGVLLFWWLVGVVGSDHVIFLLAAAIVVDKGLHFVTTPVGQSVKVLRGSTPKDASAKHSLPPKVVIVGAGAAGLATAAVLDRKNIPYVVFEKESDAGSVWESRYSRLHLHTDKWTSDLPYVELPTKTPLFISRTDFASYLKGYWRMLRLNVRFNTAVESVQKTGDEWTISLASGEALRVPWVVIAAGEANRPNHVDFAAEKNFKGAAMHSSEFDSGAAFTGKKALVIGFGASGQEVAVDLAAHGASVDVAVRSPIRWVERDFIPDRMTGSQVVLALGGWFYPMWLLDKIGAGFLIQPKVHNEPKLINQKDPKIFSDIYRCKPPTLDIGLLSLIKDKGSKVKIVDVPKTWDKYDLVVKATGYKRGAVASGIADFSSYFQPDGTLIEKRATADNIAFVGFTDLTGRVHSMKMEAIKLGNHLEKNFAENY